MPELTSANIEVIVQEVSRAGITFSHLREELVDHICCEIESAMQQGLNFENAFEKIRGTLGNKGLKKIQEDTITLIDKKYRLMKNTMKIFGLVSMAMITIGALFKIQHWPGAGLLLIFGFFFLITLFFPSALWLMKKESKLKGSLLIYLAAIIGGIILLTGILFKIQHYPGAGILLLFGFVIINMVLIPSILISKLRDTETKYLHAIYIIGALSLITYLTGLLFKIQHYPGAAPLLMLGAISLSTVFLPIYAKKVYGKTDSIKPGFLFLCIGIVFFNMFNLLLALTVSKDVLSYYVKPGEEFILTTNILNDKNEKLFANIISDSTAYDTTVISDAEKVKTQSDELCSYIERIKTKLISMVDNISFTEAETRAKTPSLIIAKDNYDVPTYLLIGNTEDGKDGMAAELRVKMEQLRKSLLEFCTGDKSTETIISISLNTDSPVVTEEEGLTVSWEMHHFYRLVTISVVNKLSCFQRNVRIAEQETLEHLKSSRSADNEVSEIKNQ